MMMRFALLAAMLSGPSTTVVAQSHTQVPIFIRWTDEAPDQIMFDSIIDAPPLKKDVQNKLFSGTIARDPTKVLRVDISVQYGSNAFPLVLKVRPEHTKLDFSVGRRKPLSCGKVYVQGIERQSTSRADAIVQAFTAGFMLQMLGNNACDDEYRPRAIRAQFRRYDDLAKRSDQLFVMPDEIKEQFRIGSNLDNLHSPLAKYELSERSAFAHALQADVIRADKAGNAASAFAASDILLDMIRNDPDAGPAFQRVRLSEEMLAKQTSDMAERMEQAAAAMSGPE